MSKSDLSVPVVLVFSGHDPSGGAGVQADIEAIISQGVHPATVITALTVQDTVDVKRFVPTDPSLVIEQARAVLEDMPVQCIKIGMIGSVALVEVIHSILKDYPDIPVVLDPVLIAGGGGALANEDVAKAMINLLLPLTTILTPNAYESRALVKVAHGPPMIWMREARSCWRWGLNMFCSKAATNRVQKSKTGCTPGINRPENSPTSAYRVNSTVRVVRLRPPLRA